ncbi:oligopeptide/dipeptide ABC transporter, ATP-binding protein, C-terminal domain-containing protein [Streptosporangium subroseum]|uniref:Oligopeptide/dipeptide ABC transporter, ATP-binding protein, C-terminal domain-containing protein n=1 Tax=Streptosporangium subroseum TaxID=106412 RepID=A0A239PAP8_9ACTN|nr:dipeptide/oligopeptide/nickel ABC transporter permease/ATP-binding protein [Streptosporangium subroseum]SNT63992.1 oligopeptide/dipeptide ABC transporter, ATP-binding protein, C-terminal domain-containing protein [Streptosporangium subroseum]
MRRLPRTPAGIAGIVLVTLMVILAIIGPPIWGAGAERIDSTVILQGASAAHPLGTDNLGRDILARVLVAGRLSLTLALLATLIGAAAGVVLGALPSVLPRRAARLVTGTVNALVAFPGLLLAMFTAVVTGLGARGAVLGIGVAIAPGFARLTQTLAASVAGADYVSAARMLGVSRRRIMTSHVLPNIAEPLILNLTQALGGALLGLAGMSFLGLGVQPPSFDWGRLLFDGLGRIYVTPAVALGPAVAVAFAGIGFNLLGDALAHAASRPAVTAGKDVPRAVPGSVEPGLDEPEPDAVLEVRDLTVTFPGGVTPVRGLSLSIAPGEIVGLVGESGSGKSLTALAIGGLVPHPGRVNAGRLRLCGTDLGELPEQERRRLLGTSLAMVFQDPMSSLNPALKVGGQLAEVATVHQGASRTEARTRAVDRLEHVHIPEPDRRARQHPHELSGGMRQRAVIAMGLMGTPRLIIADEPTTALDVTVQRQILRLLREVTDETGAATLFISHDIAVVGELCHRVVVMYAGRVVEELPVGELASGAAHPYTRALIASLPDMDTDRSLPLASIPGRQPSPAEVGGGCAFADRCELATDRCAERPPLIPYGKAHLVACWEAS